MDIIDVTKAIYDGMQVYPGDPKVKIKSAKSLKKDGYRFSEISMGLHAGTHIDAPAHFLKRGKAIDATKPILGSARVVEGKIVQGCLAKGEIPIVKGRKSITEGEAELIANCGIPAVGIGSLSIGSPEVHKKLLSKGVLIIEGLDLSRAKPGKCQIICLPMKIRGAEAAPARCLLVS